MNRKHAVSLVIGLILLVAGGCAYYNTFYNAEKYFAEAQAQPLRDNGRPAPNAIRDYNKAMKKCGIILTDYKDSKYADDALMLLAKCLYYKGSQYAQALEKLDDLITLYPTSEFVPEAMLYKAMATHAFNRKEEAYEMLRDFIADARYQDDHPRALYLLANYFLQEEDFVQAAYYFEKIISEYPESEEYEQAYFLRGQALHISDLYEESNAVFYELLKSKVSKKIKLDARYYIAYNYLELGEYSTAAKYTKRLLKQEYRTDNFSKIELLLARARAGENKLQEAETLFESVIDNNRRLLLAAEAAFYLAEMHFEHKDYQAAIEHYKRVKQESNKSPFVEQALTKSAVASQIIQYYQPDADLDVQDLVREQFKLAEYYIEILNSPDSALVVYDNIIQQDATLISRIDSLTVTIALYQDSLDAITATPDSAASQPADSLLVASTELNSITTALPDSTLTAIDSLHPDSTRTDSSRIEIAAEPIDSVAVARNNRRAALQSRLNALNAALQRAESDHQAYQDDFLPFSAMVQVWLNKTVFQDSARADSIYRQMYTQQPDSKYTFAAERYLNGQEVELISRQEFLQRQDYANAIALLNVSPDSTIAALKQVITNTDHGYYHRALYGLGHLYYFDKQDSTTAREYLNTLLAVPTLESELRTATNTFYDGEHFIVYDRLPALITLEEQKRQQEEAAKQQEAEAAKEDDTTEDSAAQTSPTENTSPEKETPTQTELIETLSNP